MKNRKIAEVLKAYRKMNNLSVRDVTDNILGTFGYTDEEPINLTKHEHHLIEQYRKHPEIQDAVDKLLDIN